MALIDSKLWKMFRNNSALYSVYRKTIGALIRNNRLSSRKEAVKKHGIDYIQEIHNALIHTNILFFVDCGTLLGFVREGHLLKWDFDVDFGLVISGSSDWEMLEENLNTFGYKKIRQFTLDGVITEQTYLKNDLSVDFFGHFNEDICSKQYAYYNSTNTPTNKLAVKEFTTIPILTVSQLLINGFSIQIPNHVEKYLEDSYGTNWRIPDPKWDDKNSPRMKILSNKYGIIEDYSLQDEN